MTEPPAPSAVWCVVAEFFVLHDDGTRDDGGLGLGAVLDNGTHSACKSCIPDTQCLLIIAQPYKPSHLGPS
jgi:hypothetical protein